MTRRQALLPALLLSPLALASGGASDAQPRPLTDLGALTLTAEAGAGVFASRGEGHCVLCHQVDGLDVPFQGDVGPALSGIGSRLTPAQIRYRIVDVSRLNPDTIMPPYFRTDGLHQVATRYQGKPVLSAAQIEQLVHYLAGLKE
jgi:sulfur-oxidizing protein SoxX